MSDLIRREDVMFSIMRANGMIHENGYILVYKNDVLDLIRLIPTAEPKMGEWIEEIDNKNPSHFSKRWRCKKCNNWQSYGKTKFCPFCGAKMRNETDK